MPTIDCRLNSLYKRALRGKRFKTDGDEYWGHPILIDTQDEEIEIAFENGSSTQCCGIDELDFNDLAGQIKEHYMDAPQEVIDELIAKSIKHQINPSDRRVVFIGFPIQTNSGGSMYDADAYRKIRSTLERFGFATLARPYTNKNSSNKIVVMAGQFPK